MPKLLLAMMKIKPRANTNGRFSRLVTRIRERYAFLRLMDPPMKGLRAYANWALSNYELRVRASRIRARPLKLAFDPNQYLPASLSALSYRSSGPRPTERSRRVPYVPTPARSGG
jgi:hypothetical protein